MDMEELSKSQIVLLTLLVSFVTSIATGIVTVSLMEQAPPAIAQTVNRVIERTVEKVVPSGQAATVITTEKTVVVKEADLIVQALEKMTPSVVKVFSSGETSEFRGLGIILEAGGAIVTDAEVLGELADAIVVLHDGTRLRSFVTSRDAITGTAFLQPATTTEDGILARFSPAVLSVGSPTLGQTVVVLSGKNIPRIADGLVTALIPRAEGEEAVIDTNISADFVMDGSPLINTEGRLLGISTRVSRMSSGVGFIPASALLKKGPEEKAAAPAKTEE